jgi:hypothetical protein
MKKSNDKTHQIKGRVIDSLSRRGVAGLRVEAWDKDLIANDLVGSDQTGHDGEFNIEFTTGYFQELFFDRKPDLFFKVFDDGELLKSTEDSVVWNVPAGTTPIEILVSAGHQSRPLGSSNGDADESDYTVSGVVSSPDRAGVNGLRVDVMDRNISGDVLLGSAPTDDRGRYKATFPASALQERKKQQPDLQARVFADKTFLGASDVRYNASHNETLDVALPANSAALASEHETLVSSLATHFNGALRDLKESGERQDITYLANKTGWDARAVALAALADQFSQQSSDAAGRSAIKPAFYYAMFRAGLPANSDTLFRTDAQTVKQVLQKAVKQGVIEPASDQEIDAAAQDFQKLSAQKRLTSAPLIGTSALKDLLAVSQLSEGEQTKFSELLTEHRQDTTKLWEAVANEFGPQRAKQLQVDGKLSLLTLNNAPLVSQIHTIAGNGGLNDPVQLAEKGLHRAADWLPLLDANNVQIPKEIPGDTPEKKKANYAEYLAAQIRISYPTASVAEMVRKGDLAVQSPAQVNTFLTQNQGQFEIGVMPAEHFIARNNLNVDKNTLTEVKQIERVYQITPDDRALNTLLKNGVNAAADVVRFERGAFIQKFGDQMGGAAIAAQTYDKSVQIHNAVLNVVVGYLAASNGIPVGTRPLAQRNDAAVAEVRRGDGDGGGTFLQPAPKARIVEGNGNGAGPASDVIAYPTLESLFGEMDFCACDHCRSILSPAAYLVDLLQFLDQAPTEVGKDNPLDVLRERRPDLENLPLTCENTNTALPYIDIVNEILEYFIANGVQPLTLRDYLGHDTGTASSADLLASPQFVMDAAYTTLRNERFPTLLPFHQPLENLRRYFDKFEVPLPLAMERLRVDDQLERGANTYGWRDILMEELSLSRDEYEILTDGGANPLWRIYGFPNGTADAGVITELSNAKQFTRRLGITYEDVVEILKTRFVNPNSDLVPKLERLGVSFGAMQALKNGTLSDADFDAMLPTGAGAPDPAEYDNDIKGWVRNQNNFDRIMAIITLVDPSADPDPCNFDHLEFRFARPMAAPDDTSTRLGAVEFVRLLRFIRLWKKLGWTVEQTDAAICALFPVPAFPNGAAAIDTVAKLDAGFLLLLPRLGLVQRVMEALNLTTKRDLLRLLTLWSPLGTHGTSALYRQMFLNAATLAQDAAFADNGYGEFLLDNTLKIADHAETLRAAFGQTGDEFDQLIEALGFGGGNVVYIHPQPTLEQAILDAGPGISYDNAAQRLAFSGVMTNGIRNALKGVAGVTGAFQNAVDLLYANQANLTFDNISAVYRNGWLARKLRISVRELVLLKRLTGLDPFAPPDATNPAIMRLIELVQSLGANSIKSAAALYLIWNLDLSGRSAPDPAQTIDFARTLRADFAAIDDQFAASEDPSGNIARARMALVYGSEATDTFFNLLEGTITFDVPYTHAAATLEPPIVAADPQITYDNFRHRLGHTGLLSAITANALKLAGPAAFGPAVDALLARSDDVQGSFFSRYPELQPLFVAYTTSAAPVEDKRKALLAAFSPELSRRRKRQQALQRLSAAVSADLTFTEGLLDPGTAAPFPLHAGGDVNRPALDDVIAVEKPGLAVNFFFRDTATAPIDLTTNAAGIDYSPTGTALPANPVPGAAISGIWTGQIETPEAGFYNFIIEADTTATVTLNLDGQAVALVQNGNVWRNNNPLELAVALHDVELTVNRVTNSLSLKWETPKRPREVVPKRYLYPPGILQTFEDVYLRFLKAASLAQALRLTGGEISAFATHADYQIAADGWLNVLAVRDEATPAVSAALLQPLRDLLDFARLKAEISPDDESLLEILQDPPAADADGSLYTLTGWDKISLASLSAHFNLTLADFTHFAQFRRVAEVFELLQTMGVTASALIKATTNNPTSATVIDLQAALRARYEADSWRDVVQPINDQMRGLQRDALVAYILHRLAANAATSHIDTADKLFEFFLMDVQMEPCMQTSRIRHALSTVQLFIERCLMNLEPRASLGSVASSLDNAPSKAKQWEWMKRYRVWEANRKVFLFPENWLEPELRDDKSPFFKEVESELLQGDITEDAAAIALLNYLSKLEEVAKLEPCGIHHMAENAEQRTSEVNHVIARTAGAHRKYYYRRYEGGSWTPWEQVKLDIEDNPVMPVVWQGRLLLFWLRILKEAPIDPAGLDGSSDTGGQVGTLTLTDIRSESKSSAVANSKVTVNAVLCWSEYYNGKWQPAKTSDIDRPVNIGSFSPTGELAFDRSRFTLGAREVPHNFAMPDSVLRIDIAGHGQGGGSFYLFNTHSLPVRREDARGVIEIVGLPEPSRNISVETDELKITYFDGLRHFDFEGIEEWHPPERTLLTTRNTDQVVAPDHTMPDPWDAPFFYEDSRHVFYVTTTEKLVEVPHFNGFGIDPGLVTTVVPDIPPLVFREEPKLPRFGPDDGDPIDPRFGVVNPDPLRRLISEDANIRTGIASTGQVSFGDVLIGPRGAMKNLNGKF